MKIVGTILSIIFYIFGVLFVWGAFGDPFDGSALAIGIIMIIVASVILLILNRKAKAQKDVTYKVDLGGSVHLDKMVCQHCGGQLSADNVQMLAGAPTVTCPYCNSSYQLTEEPKW